MSPARRGGGAPTALLDSSVVIALLADEHEHHERARRWFARQTRTGGGFATCPITQGSLIRYSLRAGHSADGARRSLDSLVRNGSHEFWADDVDFRSVRLDGVIGHRQVTDAYLAQLARAHHGRLVTLDEPLARLHSDVAELVPVAS